jgi:hypothetical protein
MKQYQSGLVAFLGCLFLGMWPHATLAASKITGVGKFILGMSEKELRRVIGASTEKVENDGIRIAANTTITIKDVDYETAFW